MKRSRLEDGTLAGYIHERSEVDVPGIKLVFDSAWKAVPPIIYLEVVPSSHRLHLVIFRAHVRFAPMYLVYEVLPSRQFRCIPCGKRRRLQPFPKKYSKKFGHTKEKQYLCTRLQEARAFSSVGLEHLPYKQRVGGSFESVNAHRGVSLWSFGAAGIFFLFFNKQNCYHKNIFLPILVFFAE